MHEYIASQMIKKKRKEPAAISGFVISATIVRRHRRHRRLLFQLFSAFSASLLFFYFAFSAAIVPPPHHHPYTLEKEASSSRDLWSTKRSEDYFGCSNASYNFVTADKKTHPNRYLLIATSGGLNQQRTGITDAVVAAYILNATLVIPRLDQKSFWQDSSEFGEIFDVEQFISSLSNDVRIIKELPAVAGGGEGLAAAPYSMRVPRKCTPKCYLSRVLPALNKRHVVQLSKFDYRLSNKLNRHLQRLRCRVNYHALKFTDPILEMGKTLVNRMRTKSLHFIALHLRYEPDMLAFSGCDYGGGEKERMELGEIRKRWKTLRVSNPDKVRRNGKCPLTPEEIGLMLRALGYGSDVHLYVASGEVYGGEKTLAPLKKMFPNFHTKETIATKNELAPFSSFSSRMAALDFIVCDESDVFVSNNNGNMARILAGRRRYFGHKPTIRPNAKKLNKLFISRSNITWEKFALGVRTHQIGFMGDPKEMKPGRGEFHENPDECICPTNENMNEVQSQVHDQNYMGTDANNVIKDTRYMTDYQDEPSLFEADYVDSVSPLEENRVKLSLFDSEPKILPRTNQGELDDELFSD